jgi:hypothetical protein
MPYTTHSSAPARESKYAVKTDPSARPNIATVLPFFPHVRSARRGFARRACGVCRAKPIYIKTKKPIAPCIGTKGFMGFPCYHPDSRIPRVYAHSTSDTAIISYPYNGRNPHPPTTGMTAVSKGTLGRELQTVSPRARFQSKTGPPWRDLAAFVASSSR